MTQIQFNHDKCGVRNDIIAQHIKKLTKPALSTIPHDTSALALAKKLPKPEHLVIIGIGGSNLGTQAVHEAILGRHHPNVHYADTVDTDSISSILETIKPAAKKGRVLVNVITKSGTTTETIANFHIFHDFLRKHDRQYKKHVVITTDKGSPLEKLAKKNQHHLLTIPDIPGRYTVLTPVSTFPLAMMDINVLSLLDGARKASHTTAQTIAAIQKEQIDQEKNISDHFIFSPDLESLGKWWRQLNAESLGKQGKGFTPTVSIGSTDLHSMTQLTLDGPRDKYTTLVSINKNKTQLKIPPLKNPTIPYLQNKTLPTLMQAIYQATKHAYTQQQIPYTELQLKDKTEKTIGQYLQTQMLTTQYLAQLLDINPYDQPAVESYKKKTRELLLT